MVETSFKSKKKSKMKQITKNGLNSLQFFIHTIVDPLLNLHLLYTDAAFST